MNPMVKPVNSRQLHKESIIVDSMGGGVPFVEVTQGAEPGIFPRSVIEQADKRLSEGWSLNDVRRELTGLCDFVKISDSEVQEEYVTRIKTSGVTTLLCTVGGIGNRPWQFENAIEDLSHWSFRFDGLRHVLLKVTSPDDIWEAKSQNRLGIILGFQNTDHIQGDLNNLELFYRLGIRVVQLTYNSRNYVGDGCTERTDSGLSDFGVNLVKRLNELGILVDLSHCSSRTVLDALESSERPVAFTHTACRALHDHPRNRTDEEIKLIAQNGGYIGIVAVPFFLGEGRVALEDMLHHVEHVVEIAGVEHVGIGRDWGTRIPEYAQPVADAMNRLVLGNLEFKSEMKVELNKYTEGVEELADWPKITEGLINRGYTKEEVRQIVGGNFMRVFGEAVRNGA